LGLLSFALCVEVWDNGFVVEHVVRTPLGPSFISGDLGLVASVTEESVQNYISRKLSDIFLLNHSVKFILERQETDVFGMVHFRFFQELNKLHVEKAKLIVHINPETHKVFALSTDIVPGWQLPSESTYSIAEAREAISTLVPSPSFKLLSDVELLYLNLNGNVHLVYKAEILYLTEVDEMRSYFYVDAIEKTLVAELNRYINAKSRTIYSAENTWALPGPLLELQEGATQPSSDDQANNAYYFTGVCYDYYYNIFGRDSFDNQGSTMLSSVHVRNNYNNAFWNGEQMAFGDGDGVTFSNFTGDLTVVCHELTHAVVQYTADLVYQNEPGALNEGFADIFGFSAFMYQFGDQTQYQWMIGGQCYTPDVYGDALRYMNNPPEDGSSYDYYPGYTGFQDNGGVHWNSGIANLAYVLAVDGGQHPQGLSSIVVTAIGVTDAETIFYNTLANYLTPNSQFANARASSVTAATNAFGANSQQAITADNCWAAVGVPSTTV